MVFVFVKIEFFPFNWLNNEDETELLQLEEIFDKNFIAICFSVLV